MTKKKIAFIIDNATVGGIETAFVNFINTIDSDRYDVSLFTNHAGNPMVESIPSFVHIYFFDGMSMKTTFFQKLKHGHFLQAIAVLFDYFSLKTAKTQLKQVILSRKYYKLSDEVFDCVIAYKHDYTSVYETTFLIKAVKKAIWIHGKLSEAANPEPKYIKWISAFDKVFCVSNWAKNYIEHTCPETIGKTEIFHNLLSPDTIIQKAAETCDIPLSSDAIKIVTVGRLSSEKGQDLIPTVISLLAKNGYNIKWYVVGDGNLREKIRRVSEQNDVLDRVILLGMKSNPYPYMKACDIYVQTSRAEGWCLTTQEAKILCKPIVTTDLPVMREQFTHMENGYITDGISPESLFEGIKALLDHPELCEKFIQNLSKETYDNTSELYKLYEFIES